MRILYISPYYSTFIHDPILALEDVDGVETFTFFARNLYLYLKKSGYRRDFAHGSVENEIPHTIQKQIFYMGLPQDLYAEKYANQISRKIERFCDVSTFDIIHAHTVSPAGVAAKILADKYKKPFVVTSHGYDFYRLFPENDPKHRGRPYSIRERASIDEMMKAVSEFITVSPVFASHVKQLYPDAPVSVIENTYNQILFNTYGKLDNSTGKKVIMTVGNFIPVKRHDVCINAFALLLKRFSNVELKIVGKGPLKQQYEKQCNELGISEYVEIIDHVKQSTLAALMKKADLYVHTSDSETFGMTIVEAMACGLPAISTNTQGPSHIITEGEDGYLVDRGDMLSLAKKMEQLLDNENMLYKFSNSATSNVKSRFSSHEKLIQLYKTVLISTRRSE